MIEDAAGRFDLPPRPPPRARTPAYFASPGAAGNPSGW